MSSQPGEINNIPWVNRLLASPALAIYNDNGIDKLFVIGGSSADANGRMSQTTFNLQQLVRTSAPPPGDEPINTDALTNSANWDSQWISMSDDNAATSTPCTYARCSALGMQDGLYLFWCHYEYGSADYVLLAAKYSGTPSQWGHTIQLLESDNKTAPVPQPSFNSANIQAADVSVTTLGDNLIILACAQAGSANDTQGGIYLAIYDTSKLYAGQNTWAAEWSTYLSTSQMQFYWPGTGGDATLLQGLAFGNTGTRISMDWLVAGADSSGAPTFYLAFSFLPQAPNEVQGDEANGKIFYLPLTVSEGPGGAAVSINVPTTLQCGESVDQGYKQIFASPVVRDPAGRLRFYNLPYQWAGYYTTLQAPSPALPLSAQADQLPTPSGVNFYPSALFYVFTPGGVATTVDGCQAMEYPVYEFVFYNACQVNRFGTIKVISDFGTTNLNPAPLPNKVNYLVSGIIDGPIPLPVENYQGITSDVDSGDITYGTQQSENSSRQVSANASVGIKGSGEATQGIGLAWDYSLNAGMGKVSGSTQESVTTYSLMQNSSVTLNGQSPVVGAVGSLQVVSAQVSSTAFQFLDVNNNLVSDATTSDNGDAPKLAMIQTTFPQYAERPYSLYSVTPGDLHSYTPEAWNNKMQSLGYTDDDGGNYFGNIICANAYPFGGQDNPYLSFSWSVSGNSAQGFKNFSSAYTERSWSLEADLYVGVSAGGGISFFGMGEEEQMSMLVGVSCSVESTTSDNTESGWGINLSKSWGRAGSVPGLTLSRAMISASTSCRFRCRRRSSTRTIGRRS